MQFEFSWTNKFSTATFDCYVFCCCAVQAVWCVSVYAWKARNEMDRRRGGKQKISQEVLRKESHIGTGQINTDSFCSGSCLFVNLWTGWENLGTKLNESCLTNSENSKVLFIDNNALRWKDGFEITEIK